jgi:hypothetical protein
MLGDCSYQFTDFCMRDSLISRGFSVQQIYAMTSFPVNNHLRMWQDPRKSNSRSTRAKGQLSNPLCEKFTLLRNYEEGVSV